MRSERSSPRVLGMTTDTTYLLSLLRAEAATHELRKARRRAKLARSAREKSLRSGSSSAKVEA